MATVNIFASFEYHKDLDLKNNFYKQADEFCPHRVRSCSLRETDPNDAWKDKAKAAIEQCDLVIILVGQDTHNAPGVKVEVDIARSLDKHIFQVRARGRTYDGVKDIDIVPWRWTSINRKIAELFG